MGFAKAFGYAERPQLTQPISCESGVLWLLAGVLIVTTAMMLATGARTYWIVGGLALLVSQLVIIAAWRDAWAGTVVNAVLLLMVAHGLLTEGPWSFHGQYLRDVDAGLSRSGDAPLVAETDLAPLPEPVRLLAQGLRLCLVGTALGPGGCVLPGAFSAQPLIRHLRVRWSDNPCRGSHDDGGGRRGYLSTGGASFENRSNVGVASGVVDRSDLKNIAGVRGDHRD
jgi:hypothetical protein